MYKTAIAACVAASALVIGLPAQEASAATLKQNALTWAKWQKGDPYQWGAAGPSKFDCSGLTYYAYGKAGKRIKRVAQDQYNYSRKISAGSAQPGDLVFFKDRYGKVFHMGIVSKSGYMIHANASGYYGRKVIEEKIAPYWGKKFNVYYGAVR
jgi:cell wall-associated NlpC family hydrolase